ncbi:MAG: TlpA disulfide reductase family protein, partial [Ignavibacteria bacterium]|nr:TlpA disulfide reductase family protein [Ignavibacteria bacterium]
FWGTMKNLIIYILFIVSNLGYAQYVIKGKVLGEDGLPMKEAKIQQLNNVFPYNYVVKQYDVNKDGTFLINHSTPGFYRMRFCGLYHKPFGDKSFSIYLDEKDTVELKVILQRFKIKDSIKTILFHINPRNGFFQNKLFADMLPDSTFRIKTKADSNYFPYAVSGLSTLENDRTTVGDVSDYYEVDRAGDYYSVIKCSRGDSLTLLFDLKKYKSFNKKESVEFVRLPENTKKFLLVTTDYERRLEKYLKGACEKRQNSNDSRIDNSYSENYDWKKELDDYEVLIKTEKDPFIRNAYQVARIHTLLGAEWYKPKGYHTKELAKMALSEIPPDSPSWSLFPWGISKSVAVLTEKPKQLKDNYSLVVESKEQYQEYINYLVAVFEKHPDNSLKEEIIRQIIHSANEWGFNNIHEKYLNIYKKEYSNTIRFESEIKRMLKQRNLEVGKQIPEFNFQSVRKDDQFVSKSEMLGKKYILNFWASWCGPCTGTIEALGNFKKKFEDLKIISVSLCLEKQHIFDYQRLHPMPWYNTHVDQGNDKDWVLKTFEVITIPKVILVDEQGIIVAMDDLDKILEILSK